MGAPARDLPSGQEIRMSHPIAEPSVSALPSLAARYFAALRPPFLLVALGSCLVGLASATATGVPLDAARATVTIVFAMLAQGGANVLNDYYDSVSGNDAANTERVFPFTGGSRMIQNGVLTEGQMLAYGTLLFAATVAAGLWLMAVSGPELLFVGAAGVFIGWAYSAPPFRLNSRGWGEVCIWIAWMLIAAGADYVQRGEPSATPWIASAGYALLVTNILFINQFPDRSADERVGKRHWVVRLGVDDAADLYLVLGIAANVCLVAGVLAAALPATALVALLAVPLTARAARALQRHRHDVARLAPAIQGTIAAALAHAALLSAGLWASRWT
jgi:1,4-dihydroxy-2-naphthoate octaprenyltransferase